MAKQIYKSGNYVIVDNTPGDYQFSTNYSYFIEEYNNFIIIDKVNRVTIPISDAANYTDDSAVAYTESTLRDFLLTNTSSSSSSGGGGSAAPVGATLMKTNQTTSYATGDDGDIEAGRATDFFTLASANPFGTTERFTDELGGQTYTNKIIIDWSTYNGTDVLGYTDLSIVDNWNNVLNYCNSLSVGTYTSGWRMANIKELYNVSNFEAWPHSYFPFNIFNLGITFSMMWASTSYPYDPVSQAAAYNWNYFNLFWRSKTSSLYYTMPVRNFTVNGTTLT